MFSFSATSAASTPATSPSSTHSTLEDSKSVPQQASATDFHIDSVPPSGMTTPDSVVEPPTTNGGTKTSKILLTDPFGNETSQNILDAVQKLRDLGIAKELVPEIVIVGDQSSGKSSLLRSMTDFPFPVGDGLCTRFPTQIVSRRTKSGPESVTISLVLGNVFGQNDIPYGDFTQTVPALTEQRFKEKIEEASEILGVEPPAKTGHRESSTKNFSCDILKIEISGPTRSQFSITDLPGIFASRTTAQTQRDREEVKGLVKSWMVKPSTIIVAVASATSNASNQGIFDLALECDPGRSRTIGVITKCDLIDSSAETLKLARNERIPLEPYGWYVVRNLGEKDIKRRNDGRSVDRQEEEAKLFSNPPWDVLDENHRGVNKLRDFLSDLLLQDSIKKIPEFEQIIRSRIAKTQDELKKMGDARDTPMKQAQYLSSITDLFRDIAKHSLDGGYTSSEFLVNNDVKVRKILAEANKTFGKTMRERGHEFNFINVERKEVPVKATIEPNTTTRQAQPDALRSTALTAPQPTTTGFGQSITSGTAGNRPTTPQPSTGGLFGPKPEPSSSTSLFGNNDPATSITFGTAGNRPTTPQPSTGGLFRPKPEPSSSTSLFGKNDPATPSQPRRLFGNGFGSTSGDFSSTAGGFGSSALSPGFGATPLVFPLGPFGTVETRLSPPFGAEPSKNNLIEDQIKTAITENQGKELPGMPNPQVIPDLFRKQTVRWRFLAHAHLKSVQEAVHESSKKILKSACEERHADPTIYEKLCGCLEEFNRQAVKKAEGSLNALIETTLTATAQTNNEQFATRVRKARLLRFQNALDRYIQNTNQTDKTKVTVNAEQLFDELHISNVENLSGDIHDMLQAYYELELARFNDNVTGQVIEPYANSLGGPDGAFSSSWLHGLTPEKLAYLTAEGERRSKTRREKRAWLESLQSGKDILKQLNIKLAEMESGAAHK